MALSGKQTCHPQTQRGGTAVPPPDRIDDPPHFADAHPPRGITLRSWKEIAMDYKVLLRTKTSLLLRTSRCGVKCVSIPSGACGRTFVDGHHTTPRTGRTLGRIV